MFLGLMQSLLARHLRGSGRPAGVEIPPVGPCAAVIFAIGHIGIDWTTLTSTTLAPLPTDPGLRAQNLLDGGIVVAELAATALLR